MTDKDIEKEIQAKGKTAARITPDHIEGVIASEHYFTAGDGFAGALSASDEFNKLSEVERVINPTISIGCINVLRFCSEKWFHCYW